MQRWAKLPRPAFVLLMVAGLAMGLALLLIRRRRDRGDDEPGEDIGHSADASTISAPEVVALSGEIPPRHDDEPWEDLSERRRLPIGPYRPAPDEPATEPEAAP